MGIEPTPLAWKAKVLPLNYTRQQQILTFLRASLNLASRDDKSRITIPRLHLQLNQIKQLKEEWWWGMDSNQRTQRERIYSPSPLTTRPPHHQLFYSKLEPVIGIEPMTY